MRPEWAEIVFKGVTSSIFETRVGITNEFYKGNGIDTSLKIPYDAEVYNGMRDEFTVMAWLKLNGEDTEDDDVISARHDHFVLYATGGSWKEAAAGQH